MGIGILDRATQVFIWQRLNENSLKSKVFPHFPFDSIKKLNNRL
jgi:hypothetical protein